MICVNQELMKQNKSLYTMCNEVFSLCYNYDSKELNSDILLEKISSDVDLIKKIYWTIDIENEYWVPLIHTMISYYDTKLNIVKLLIDKWVNVNVIDKIRWQTPIQFSLILSNLEAIDLLLDTNQISETINHIDWIIDCQLYTM